MQKQLPPPSAGASLASRAEQPAVEITGLTVAHGERRALDSVSLQVPHGAVAGLLGPNGSGKTTLLSVLLGLRAPTSGSVRVLGQPPAPSVRQQTGAVFQESCLDPRMTVAETLDLQAALFGLVGQPASQRTEELLRWFNLRDRRHDTTSTLSGGLKRRLELARALIPGPRLLLLDEPTTGLDPEVRQSLWEHLRQVNEAGTTILLSTHDMLEADRNCDTVAFIHKGRLLAQGAPAELKRHLRHDSVQLEWPGLTGEALAELTAIEGAGQTTWAPPLLHVTVDSARAFVPQAFQIAGDGIRGLQIRESTLEDAYFQIVGQAGDKDE